MMYDRIKKLAKEKGISINSLEDKVDIAKGSLCKIDKHKPSYERLFALANALDTNIDYITGKSDDPVSYKNMFPDREDEFESLIQQETEKENELLLEVYKMDDDKLSRLIQYAKFINSQND